MASKQEQVWLAEYLKCFNATEAARRADYAWPNKTGPRKLDKFAKEISEALRRKTLSVDAALARFSEIATFDVSPYVVQNGGGQAYLDANKMIEDGYGYLIRGAYTTRDGARIEISDPDDALKTILQHHQRAGVGPQEHVVMSLDEWKDEAERRRQEVAETMGMFDEEE